MKRFITCICLSAMLFASVAFQFDPTASSEVKSGQADETTLRSYKHDAFKRGEILKYRMHYGWLEAGIATIEVKDEAREIAGRKTYHVVGTGESKGTFDFFFKVRDKYESYIDE